MFRSSPGNLNRKASDRRPAPRRRRGRRLTSGCGTDDRQAGLAEHDPRLLDGVGHDLVVARQRAQLVPRLLVEIAEDVRRQRRRQPVRLGEDDVEGDGGRAELGQPRDQVGDARARPRQLAELAQAFLVDIDDDDRPLRRHARLDDLEEIEGPQAKLFERARIGDAQEQQREQQRHAQRSRGCEPPRQTRKPFHVEPARAHRWLGAPSPSLLPEHPHQLIVQRLDQIGNHRPVAGLHEGLDRHARHQLDLAELGHLVGRHGDPDGVIGLPGALIGRGVGRDAGDRAVDLRRGALVEGREAQQRGLAELHLVDVLRIDLGLDRKVVGVGHDQHDRVAGGDDAADGVDVGLEHHAVLRRADVDALELVLGGDLALDELADLAVDLAQSPWPTSLLRSRSIWMICNSVSEILPAACAVCAISCAALRPPAAPPRARARSAW